ncbi:VOC family protein [Nocardiopsis sp. HNM0947]|uniref:VOC family protein n=1 Tax=Nocardiopsis coralli TaxID=2772213 RepID=A0ABR9P8H8_9ACTN|nr:VOC family protein [Nocardiopsis coralli]MBE3000158.1 VOC family protein [Nocardiopsis coralli]
MTVTSAYAVIPTADLAAARTWWTRLLGREPDRVPMPTDLEWFFASDGGSQSSPGPTGPSGGGLQVVDDPEHAGAGSVTLGVDDVDAELAGIEGRGLDVPQAETVPSGQFRLAILQDPDGNTVVLGQDLTT